MLHVAGEGSPKQNEGSFREGKGEKWKPPAERTAGAKAQGRDWVKSHLGLAEGGSEMIYTDVSTTSCVPTKTPVVTAERATGAERPVRRLLQWGMGVVSAAQTTGGMVYLQRISQIRAAFQGEVNRTGVLPQRQTQD